MTVDFYPKIFLEALHHASIIPFGSEPTVYAMKAFGTYPMAALFVLALVGAILGQMFNWYVGRLLLYYEHKEKFRVSAHQYERARKYFNTYGIFLLLFSWAMLANLLVVLAGFLNIPLKKSLPLIAVGLAVHYGLSLL